MDVRDQAMLLAERQMRCVNARGSIRNFQRVRAIQMQVRIVISSKRGNPVAQNFIENGSYQDGPSNRKCKMDTSSLGYSIRIVNDWLSTTTVPSVMC